jgi:hypothetical protein
MIGSHVRQLLFFGTHKVTGRLDFSKSSVLGPSGHGTGVTDQTARPAPKLQRKAGPDRKPAVRKRAYSRARAIRGCVHSYPEGTLTRAKKLHGQPRFRCEWCGSVFLQRELDEMAEVDS